MFTLVPTRSRAFFAEGSIARISRARRRLPTWFAGARSTRVAMDDDAPRAGDTESYPTWPVSGDAWHRKRGAARWLGARERRMPEGARSAAAVALVAQAANMLHDRGGRGGNARTILGIPGGGNDLGADVFFGREDRARRNETTTGRRRPSSASRGTHVSARTVVATGLDNARRLQPTRVLPRGSPEIRVFSRASLPHFVVTVCL
mmetsp:Transcript_3344/g.12438  ORF Transcript_3344/g.12438 Transcript_3344/m.12438 type:complete len:205 (-) Transcript_3344:54-668(-)